MERISRIGPLMRAAVAASTTRPTLAADGVDISSWVAAGGNRMPRDILVGVRGDGTSTGLGNPTGGANGPEIWSYLNDETNTPRWTLVGYLNSKAAIVFPAAAIANASYAELVQNTPALLGSRIAIAGAPTTGGAVNCFVEGIERSIGAGI